MSYLPKHAAGIALLQLRRMVALSASFQSACGVANELDATALIGVGRSALTTGAVLYCDAQPLLYEFYASGDQNRLKPRGTLACILSFPESTDDDVETRYLKGLDAAAGTAAEISARANADNPQANFDQNHLGAVRLDMTYGSLGNPQHELSGGSFFRAKLLVDWGDGV